MAQRPQTGAAPANGGAIGAEAFAQSTQAALASTLAGPQRMAEIASEALAEWMTFVSRRAKAQAELYGELSHCHDVDQAVDMQRRFVAKCTKDYSDELTQLMELGQRNMQRVASLALPQGEQAGTQGRAA